MSQNANRFLPPLMSGASVTQRTEYDELNDVYFEYALKGQKWIQVEDGQKAKRVEYDELNDMYIEDAPRSGKSVQSGGITGRVVPSSDVAAESESGTPERESPLGKLGFNRAAA
jgi:hypothetical protein